MSLFKAREWWAASVDSVEEFDQGCLCLTNIDNADDQSLKIVTGSFQGVLRVYAPKKRDYKIEDLLLEQQLEEPILCLAAGRFSNLHQGLHLAILHPRRLAVMSLSTGANGGQVEVNNLYDHPLDRPACNFTCGPFGGQGKDFICVQSMDGLLSFFEQESRAFSIFLNNFLLPGPIVYNAKTDSFLTVNSCLEIECYKYSELAASASPSNSGSEEEQSALTAFKKLQVHWSLSLGENALGLQLGRFCHSLAPGQQDIVLVSQRHITCIKDNGQIRAQKRLDYAPSCFQLYDLAANTNMPAGQRVDGLLVGTHNETVMIYHDMELKWAARLSEVPVALNVGRFGELDGLVAALDEQGQTKLLYMGSDPPTAAVGAGANSHKELNYEQMDDEHRRLLGLIREATSESRSEPKDVIVLSASEPVVGGAIEGEDLVGINGAQVAQVRLHLSHSGSSDIDNISVTISTPQGIKASQSFLQIPRLCAGHGTPIVIVVSFVAVGGCIPPSLVVTATASYKSAAGEPRTSHCEIAMPLAVVATVVTTARDPNFKFTIDTNQPPVHLPTLYQDMAQALQQPDGSLPAANLISFKYITGEELKVIASKNAGRYRIQAENLGSMCHITADLVSRLKDFYKNQGQNDFECSFTEGVPLPEYLELVDHHYELRHVMQAQRDLLAERAQQFRAVEKRLLVRFKERNPSPIGELDLLLEGSYEELLALGNAYEEQQAMLARAACDLACGTKLILLLLQYRYAIDDENMQVLRAHWSEDVDDNLEQGWEERINAALLHLLRTTLAKSGKKDGDSVMHSHSSGMLEDVGKLKKHISLVVDRIAKGLRPAKFSNDGAADKTEAEPETSEDPSEP